MVIKFIYVFINLKLYESQEKNEILFARSYRLISSGSLSPWRFISVHSPIIPR